MRDPIHEQLVAARRNQILDAAVKLFAGKGFHSTTIRDIAREAAIAEGTVYVYFENKAALLSGILDRMRESVLRSDAPPHDAPRDLRAFLRAFLRYPLAAPGDDGFALFRVVLSEIMVNEEMRARYAQQILAPNAAAVTEDFQRWAMRDATTPLDVELITHMLSAMVLGLIVAHIAGDELLIQRWDALPDLLADLLVDGLGGPQA